MAAISQGTTVSVPSFQDTLRMQLEIALDRVADGVVLIDGAARVLHVNRPAREFLTKRQYSTGHGGTLTFVHPRTQCAFRRALQSDPANDDTPEYPRREFLVLNDANATIARAAVEPLRRASTAESGTFLVSLHPQPQDAQVSPMTLTSLYGLSPSEARVAAQVVTVKSLADLADRMSLSRNTIKAHLKRIFRKCEVGSFAQLTALVATGPGVR
jgi:DNA-binding CsgD family transcriptional regulator